MPLGAIALACTESGPARPMAGEGRFPVLRRMSATAVVPREEGVEGWLWTESGGSAFPLLCDEDQAPNVAILFAHPLGADTINRRFDPEFATAIAARSALGSPAVYGLLMRVGDLLLAQRTFTKFGVAKQLTDREVGPTLRRALPTDARRSMVRVSDSSPRSALVAPPGLGSRAPLPSGAMAPQPPQPADSLPPVPRHGPDHLQPRRLPEHRDVPVVRGHRRLHPGPRRAAPPPGPRPRRSGIQQRPQRPGREPRARGPRGVAGERGRRPDATGRARRRRGAARSSAVPRRAPRRLPRAHGGGAPAREQRRCLRARRRARSRAKNHPVPSA